MYKLTKKMLLKLSLLVPLSSYALYNTAYVEVNSNQLANVGCYQLSEEKIPFFDMAVIFAANINGRDPNNPEVYFNESVRKVLNDSKQISYLKKKGIKVLLTILGNHQNAGWSCMTDATAAAKFANKLASITRQYKLDGIDIDDEYSTCAPNNYSMIMIAQLLKDNPLFKGKILTKALWQDASYFSYTYHNYKLADFLDYGWEMSYGSGGPGRLFPYTGYGMSRNSLALGISTHDSSSEEAGWVAEAINQGYGGTMVYDLTNHAQDYLSDIAKAEYGQRVKVIPNCLN